MNATTQNRPDPDNARHFPASRGHLPLLPPAVGPGAQFAAPDCRAARFGRGPSESPAPTR